MIINYDINEVHFVFPHCCRKKRLFKMESERYKWLKMLYSLIGTCAQKRSPLFIQTVYLGFISFYVLAKLDCCVFITYFIITNKRMSNGKNRLEK